MEMKKGPLPVLDDVNQAVYALEGDFEAKPETVEHYGVKLLAALNDTNKPKTESRPQKPIADLTLRLRGSVVHAVAGEKGIAALCTYLGWLVKPAPMPWRPCDGGPEPWYRITLVPPVDADLEGLARELNLLYNITVEVVE